MNKYETVILININISKDERIKVLEKIKNYITENGEITKVEDLGKKQLAYEIKKQKEAYYYLIQFNTYADNIYELQRIYRITDEILKFIVVKLEN
ncbi:MAG: 30S ribosomal protein S6 [Clostridia bacterium]|nr:30S ribosomal protein S6 [Clostridia bacterium]